MAEVAVAVVEAEVQGDPQQDQEVAIVTPATRMVNQTRWSLHHIVQEKHRVQHVTP